MAGWLVGWLVGCCVGEGREGYRKKESVGRCL